MGAPKHKKKNKGYKRSWKNLLLDKSYQLKFTLFMVAISAVLMAGLGWWVMDKADDATTVGENNILTITCPEKPRLLSVGAAAPATLPAELDPTVEEGAVPEPEADVEPEAEAEPLPADEAAADDAIPEEDGRPEVVIEESTMTMDREAMEAVIADFQRNAVPEDYVARLVANLECEMGKRAKINHLRDGRRHILYTLVGVGVLLVFFLAAYGIKMTHKVAGPLFKVSLYFKKLKEGRYDTVYNLRRGDQLVEFYDHFKKAHAGLRAMQEKDIEELRAMIATAEEHDLASKSPEIAAALDQMRELLEKKEGSLE